MLKICTSKKDGSTYYDVYFDLVVTLSSAVMKFSAEVSGKEVGSVIAKYDQTLLEQILAFFHHSIARKRSIDALRSISTMACSYEITEGVGGLSKSGGETLLMPLLANEMVW